MKLYVDFDNTIVNSTEVVVKMLNKKYSLNKDYTELSRYDFKDLFPMVDKLTIGNCFKSKELFDEIVSYEFCIYSLDFLVNKLNYELTIATIGDAENIKRKEEYLLKNMNCKYNLIGLTDIDKDKRELNMENSIFIDDNVNFLRNSNAKYKILFKTFKNGEWNNVSVNDEDIWVVDNWYDIYKILVFLNKNEKELF